MIVYGKKENLLFHLPDHLPVYIKYIFPPFFNPLFSSVTDNTNIHERTQLESHMQLAKHPICFREA